MLGSAGEGACGEGSAGEGSVGAGSRPPTSYGEALEPTLHAGRIGASTSANQKADLEKESIRRNLSQQKPSSRIIAQPKI